MALRVARGLFRLWLVLSVLWIGGVGVMTWLDVTSRSRGLAWADTWFASVVAVVPPVLLLALGSALVWAFRGFR